MGKSRMAAIAFASSLVLLGLVGGSASAQSAAPKSSNGEVEVFVLDKLVPVKKFQNPSGCYSLPPGTHVVINDTDSIIQLHATPNCMDSPVDPSVDLEPGYGAHELPVFGSFSV